MRRRPRFVATFRLGHSRRHFWHRGVNKSGVQEGPVRAGWGTYPARRAARRGKPIMGRLPGALLARLWPLAGRAGRGGVEELIHVLWPLSGWVTPGATFGTVGAQKVLHTCAWPGHTFPGPGHTSSWPGHTFACKKCSKSAPKVL